VRSAHLHRELLAERAELADVARAVRDERRPFVLRGRWAGGGAIAGGCPVRELAPGEDPFGALDDLPALTAPPPSGAVGGGWFGLLGFGLARDVETLPPSPPARGAVAPLHALAFYDHVLRLDPLGRCWFEALSTPATHDALRERAAELRARVRAPQPESAWSLDDLDVLAPGLDGHAEAVAATIERIHAGEVFQANLCVRLAGRLAGSPLDAWLALMAEAPAAYGAFVGWDDGAILSASPELFLRRDGRMVVSSPMKGTRPRAGHSGEGAAAWRGDEAAASGGEGAAAPGGDEAAASGGGEAVRRADAAAGELARAPKDAAEHVMIVDLMRNDLGRVCAYGTVEASAPRVEAHPGVWQMVSDVRGELRPEVTDRELLQATFPPGSVTGAPKVQALKVIAAEEATARGAHCGAIGFASPATGLELSVAIRTFELAGDQIALGVGGGIVADSDPAAEVRECLDKAAPLLAALRAGPPRAPSPGPASVGHLAGAPSPHGTHGAGSSSLARPRRTTLTPLLGRGRTRPDPALGVFETVLVEDGEPVDLDAHLARLADALRTGFGHDADVASADVRARALAAQGAAALRLLATPAPPAGSDGRRRDDARGLRGGRVEIEVRARELPARDPRQAIALTPVLLPGGLGARKWRDRRLLADHGPHAAVLICDRGGEVLEAAWANVWAVEGDTLVTPPADGRLLPGVTRARLLREPGRAGYAGAREERIGLDRLYAADAVLLTSALGRLLRATLEGPARWRTLRAPPQKIPY
jgi:para-aminobenzoate synthetase/4-amino-4-deoxychorismate lyase